MAQLSLRRYAFNDKTTIGLMFLNNEFICYTLEDAPRVVKIAGQTRIPAGEYKIKIRNEGGLTEKYKTRFPDMHKGMIWLQDVPDYQWVYIHLGNDSTNTEGCILIGDKIDNVRIGDGFLGSSSAAYERLYPKLVEYINGEGLAIKIFDEKYFVI